MKKILCLLFVLCSSVVLYAIDLDGKYLSQSGELMFRFCADSLYIDIAQSHRNVSAFKLVKNKEDEKSTTYDAFETYLVVRLTAKCSSESFRKRMKVICSSTSARTKTVITIQTKDTTLRWWNSSLK